MKINTSNRNGHLELAIELTETNSLSCAVTPPDGKVSFVDILPEIYMIYTTVLESTLAEQSTKGVVPSCSNGCDICCYQLITVSIHEAILLAYIVDNLGTAEKKRLKTSFANILITLEKNNLLKDLIDFHTNHFGDKELISSIQKEYWNLKLSCPFLLDNSCSIYPYRPLICRQYLVSSDPVCCKGSFKNDHLVTRIPLTHDFASAAASFDGEEAITTRGIPLPIIFLIDGLLNYFPRPKASAEEMITRFLKHVDEHFKK